MISRSSHGASKLANILWMSKRSTNITSSRPISSFRTDKMRSAISILTKRALPPNTSPIPHSADPRFWQPQNGIVFDVSSSSRKMSTLNLDSTRTEPIEPEILSYPNTNLNEDFYTAEKLEAGVRALNSKDAEEPAKKATSSTENAGLHEKAVELDEEDSAYKLPSYQLSERLFEEAKNATPGSPQSYWSHRLYRRPEKHGDKLPVHYCKTKETTERIAQLFKDDKVIGFDIEWSVPPKAGAKNNVSLIQIANEERIALFHIALFPKNEIEDLVAPTLKKIMEDPKIAKVGVHIKADCTRLRKHLNIECQGIFELSNLYKLVRYSLSGEPSLINKRLVSLQTQVEEHLKLPMFKGDDVRSSDWAKALNFEQIMYAASDSYAGLRLYHILEQQRKQLKPTPPRPHFAELGLPIRLADGVMIETAEEQPEELETNQLQPEDSSNTATTTITTSTTFQTTTTTTSTPKPKQPPKEKAPITPEALAADNWVLAWKSSLPKVHVIRATNRQLQAYSLWHIQKFSVGEVAALLREQPLADSTVKSYILEAVQAECLDFDKARMRELVDGMGDLALSRYRRIVGQIGL